MPTKQSTHIAIIGRINIPPPENNPRIVQIQAKTRLLTCHTQATHPAPHGYGTVLNLSPKIDTKSTSKTNPEIWTQTKRQPKLWQSWEMNHNSSCRCLIRMIQKPSIKFTNAATISMQDLSQNSLYSKIGAKIRPMHRIKIG